MKIVWCQWRMRLVVDYWICCVCCSPQLIYRSASVLNIFSSRPCLDFASSVQVSFDKPDSGFFFKHSTVQPQQQLLNNPISDLKNSSPSSKESKDSVLSFNRFTVAQANHPVSIRASYGPFSTKQTVPARYIVPEDSDNFGQTKVSTCCLNDVLCFIYDWRVFPDWFWALA